MSRERLCILYLPSPQEHDWRRAIGRAAEARGWRHVDYVEGQALLPEEVADRVLVNTSLPIVPPGFQADEVAVIGCDPGQAIAQLMQTFGIDQTASIQYVARCCAGAAELARRGAPHLDSTRDTHTFRHLGELSLGCNPASHSAGDESPLSFFKRLPPQPGDSAEWPNWLCLRHEPVAGRNVDDLTGRRRILQYGPYVTLSSGTWAIDVEFALNIDQAATELRFEWGTGIDAARETCVLGASGVYHIRLTKFWVEPAASELRIWLDRAMFDGRMTVRRCIVTLISDEPMEGSHIALGDGSLLV